MGALFTGGSIADATTGASGGDDAVWGRKPETAEFMPVDLQAEIGRATGANLANLDSINALLERIMPGYTGMLAQAGRNNSALLRGEIPDDVAAQVQRNSAYKAVQGGYAGSGMGKALTARDFGRTSLDLQQLGGNSAQQWATSAQQAYSPWLVSAQEMAGNTRTNNAGEQAYQQRVFDVAAAPDPAAAGKFGIDSAIGMQMLSMGMGAAGAAYGGGGGGGGGQQWSSQQFPSYSGNDAWGAGGGRANAGGAYPNAGSYPVPGQQYAFNSYTGGWT